MKMIKAKLTDKEYERFMKRCEEKCRHICTQAGIDIARVMLIEETEDEILKKRHRSDDYVRL